MKKIVILLLFCSLAAGGQNISRRILIYTHNGKGYVHENIAASVDALKKLCKENGYAADATEDPEFFTAANLAKFQCIIFSNTNNEAFTSESQKKAFVDYIHNGGGFVGIHSASGSERQWPWYWAMIGGKFVRHPKYQTFTIKVFDKNHPATKFLGDQWEWEDECYFLNHLNPGIHVLLAADLTSIEDDKKSEYPGDTFGNYFPIAWCQEFEGGRQFYTALGHHVDHYKNETFLNHLLGGIQWTMSIK